VKVTFSRVTVALLQKVCKSLIGFPNFCFLLS